jgi:hypothetical protein
MKRALRFVHASTPASIPFTIATAHRSCEDPRFSLQDARILRIKPRRSPNVFRTHWIVALTLILLASPRTERALADTPLDADVINAGLRSPTSADQNFVNNVVALANKGKLPANLVETTFLWAQKKPAKIRFQYFKRALILQAKNLGITGLAPKSS